MAGIECQELFASDGVADVEFVRTDDVAFGADAEQFWFDGVEIEFGRYWVLEDGIERFDEAFARAFAISGSVFVTIGNPEIGDASFAKAFADGCADIAAGDAVTNPELADGFISMGERETVGSFGMGKEGLIEIEAESV